MRAKSSVMALAALLACLACLPSAAVAQASGCPILSAAGRIGLVSRSYDITNEKVEVFAAPAMDPKTSTCTKEQYKQLAQNIVDVMVASDHSMAYLLRAGFHACGSWSAVSRDGGCNGGWLKFPADKHHGHNAGLPEVLDLMEAIHANWTCITYSDLITFAAAVGVETSGGPPIAWYPGRRDSTQSGPSQPAYSSRLPEGAFDAAGVMYYYTQLGLTVREMVALTGGGHSLGGADATASGWNGSFTSFGDYWPTPKNKYFVDSVKYAWVPKTVERGDRFAKRVQYEQAPGQDAQYTTEAGVAVIRMPADMALRTSRVFSEWTLHYARNEAAFLEDFSRVMQRVLHFGAAEGQWTPDTANVWNGWNGNWSGWGPVFGPQLDTDGAPALNSIELTAAMDVLADQLSNPGVAFTGSLEPTPPAPPAPPANITLPPIGGPPVAAGTVTKFDYPQVTVNGVANYLDWCLDFGADCGEPVARAYCKYLGFDDVKSFSSTALNSPDGMTRLLSGASKVCITSSAVTCQTFPFIECKKN